MRLLHSVFVLSSCHWSGLRSLALSESHCSSLHCRASSLTFSVISAERQSTSAATLKPQGLTTTKCWLLITLNLYCKSCRHMKCTQRLQAADSWGTADVRDGGELVISQIEIDSRAAVCLDVLKLGAGRKKKKILFNQKWSEWFLSDFWLCHFLLKFHLEWKTSVCWRRVCASSLFSISVFHQVTW